MIGFVKDEQVADMVLNGIKDAQISRGLPVFWTIGKYPIYTGEHAGKVFMPCDDAILATNLRNGQTPMDFPEAADLIAALGGLEARIDLDPSAIVDPNAELP